MTLRQLPPRDQDGVTQVNFTRAAERRTAADRAHLGDVEGAWGTLRVNDPVPRRGFRMRLRALLAVMGPGVIVLMAGNDAGGVSLYAQAGQEHGYTLTAVLPVLALILFVNQEMVARLGAVTGMGHARLILERFGTRWGRFAVADLLAVNALTIVTEFIGVDLALGYFGVSRYVAVPLAAVALIGVTTISSFRGWERAMYVAVGASLCALPLALLTASRHAARHMVHSPNVPLPAHGLLLGLALVGTTVAPWQLFMQQSLVADKRLTSRWVGYERTDTALGTALFAIGAAAIVVVCAATVGHGHAGHFVDAGRTAGAIRRDAGAWAGALFAFVLLSGSLLGAAAVALSTSYALSDATGLRQSLHRPFRQAPVFYGSFAALIVAAAALVLVPGLPLGLLTELVNVLAGILLPSATVFLLLLCNDAALLGPWVNPRWLNVVAGAGVCSIVLLSATVVVRSAVPSLPAGLSLGVLAAIFICVAGVSALRTPGRPPHSAAGVALMDRGDWSMPSLDILPPLLASRAQHVGLALLRGYLLIAVVVIGTRIGFWAH